MIFHTLDYFWRGKAASWAIFLSSWGDMIRSHFWRWPSRAPRWMAWGGDRQGPLIVYSGCHQIPKAAVYLQVVWSNRAGAKELWNVGWTWTRISPRETTEGCGESWWTDMSIWRGLFNHWRMREMLSTDSESDVRTWWALLNRLVRLLPKLHHSGYNGF